MADSILLRDLGRVTPGVWQWVSSANPRATERLPNRRLCTGSSRVFFDFETMRDRMLKVVNDETPSHN